MEVTVFKLNEFSRTLNKAWYNKNYLYGAEISINPQDYEFKDGTGSGSGAATGFGNNYSGFGRGSGFIDILNIFDNEIRRINDHEGYGDGFGNGGRNNFSSKIILQ